MYELPPVPTAGEDGPLRLRIEIFQSSDGAIFTAKLLRWDDYLIKPVFFRGFDADGGAHVELLMLDGLWDESTTGTSEREIFDAVTAALARQFGW